MGIKICNLCCGHGHVFEGWFRSDEELEADLKEGRIECPVCGDPCVAKRPSAPNFVRVQGTTRTDVAADVAARGWERAREMQADAMKVLREAAAMAEDVGERFPETVRDIHDGRAERRLVKGTCSGEEAQLSSFSAAQRGVVQCRYPFKTLFDFGDRHAPASP